MLLDRLLFRSHLVHGETLHYVVHQHWFPIYKPVVKIGFFGLLFPALLFLMFPPGFWLFALWFTLGFLRFLYEMIDWYYDVLLITNLGVIDLDWRGFFDKSSARVEYESIGGVAYEKSGFFANVLNFGTLVIEKEGHEGHIALPFATDPKNAEHHILSAKEECMSERGLEDSEKLKDLLVHIIKGHVKQEKEKRLADLM